jgi:hypothetical protein
MFTVMLNALTIKFSSFDIDTHLLPDHYHSRQNTGRSSHINTREHSCFMKQRTNFVFIK